MLGAIRRPFLLTGLKALALPYTSCQLCEHGSEGLPPVHEPRRGSKPLRLISLALLLFTFTYLPAALATDSFYLYIYCISFASHAERTNEKTLITLHLSFGLSSVIAWKKHAYDVFLDLIAVYFDNVTSW